MDDLTQGFIDDARKALSVGRVRKAQTLLAPLLSQWESVAPEYFRALSLTAAECAIASGQPKLALEWLARWTAVGRTDYWVLHLQAICLRDLGQPDAALSAWRVALSQNPTFEQGYQGLAATLSRRGAYDDAETTYAQWAAINPSDAGLWFSRGLNLAQMGDYLRALEALQQAAQLGASWPQAMTAVAWVLRRLGRLEEAEQQLRTVIAVAPEEAEAQWALASVLLLQCQYQEGFVAFEWRLRRGRTLIAPTTLPLWNGADDLRGKRILVLHEQGVGDALQMVRFAERLADKGAEVCWQAIEGTQSLIASAVGVAEVVGLGESCNGVDLCCPMMSLPHRLGVASAADLLVREPVFPGFYTPIEHHGEAADELSSPYRIGVVWRGNPTHEDDAARSLPLPWWEPLLGQPLQTQGRPVVWVSLQAGDNRPDFDPALQQAWFTEDWGPELKTFADTAVLLGQLDAVVSVDTAVLHLAASIGLPTWGLLPFASDWRWGACGPGEASLSVGRETSPWYSSLRLFRCDQPFQRGEAQKEIWQRTLRRLKAALADQD